MSRRALLFFALLCPACAGGSGPTEPSDPGPVEITDLRPADPIPVPDPIPDPCSAPPDDPNRPRDAVDLPAQKPPAPDPSGNPGDPGDRGGIDCDALAKIGEVGCLLARLACAFAEALPVGRAEIGCDIAVPLACGFSSAIADAALALCRD